MWGTQNVKRPPLRVFRFLTCSASRSLACWCPIPACRAPSIFAVTKRRGFHGSIYVFRWKNEEHVHQAAKPIGQDQSVYGKGTGRKFLVYNNILEGPDERPSYQKRNFSSTNKNRPARHFTKHPTCFLFENGPPPKKKILTPPPRLQEYSYIREKESFNHLGIFFLVRRTQNPPITQNIPKKRSKGDLDRRSLGEYSRSPIEWLRLLGIFPHSQSPSY